jgi:hypothetical protein
VADRTDLHCDLAVICCEAEEGRGKHVLKRALWLDLVEEIIQ